MVVGEQYCYLTTRGRKSGLPREIEIWFVENEGRIYILAEHGLKAHWVQNIAADPNIHIRIGEQTCKGTARILDPASDGARFAKAQELEQQKYGWGEGLPVEITLEQRLNFRNPAGPC